MGDEEVRHEGKVQLWEAELITGLLCDADYRQTLAPPSPHNIFVPPVHTSPHKVPVITRRADYWSLQV